MNVKKSAAYCKLIENVKNKYRKNPIYTKNLTLGWCDLRQGEDLCQEINLWTYWQGRDYAKKTPHIKYMLIGQDFGPPEKEEIKGTIANVRKMNDGVDVMFHENVDLEARDSQTDKNIVRYFELLGKNEIDKKKYPDLFFRNCNLGYRRDKYSGNMTRKILANDAAEIKSLIDIIEPENIICMGLDTSVVVIRTLIDKEFSCNRVSELIGTGEPYIYGETHIYPVAHPGYWGTRTRGEDNVMANEFIDKIVVHERDRKGSIQTTQRVDIYFSFIGTFVPPAEPIDPEVAAAMEAERQAIEAKKDRLHQNYLKRKANGSQQKYEARYESRRIARMKELKETLPKNSMSVAEYYAMRKETRTDLDMPEGRMIYEHG